MYAFPGGISSIEGAGPSHGSGGGGYGTTSPEPVGALALALMFRDGLLEWAYCWGDLIRQIVKRAETEEYHLSRLVMSGNNASVCSDERFQSHSPSAMYCRYQCLEESPMRAE
jgi:hypothetical protein